MYCWVIPDLKVATNTEALVLQFKTIDAQYTYSVYNICPDYIKKFTVFGISITVKLNM